MKDDFEMYEDLPEIEVVKNSLINTSVPFDAYCNDIGLDESQQDELRNLLAGEIEQCTMCTRWRETYDIDTQGVCSICTDSGNWSMKGAF